MPTILIVDDVEALAEQYAYDLRRVGDYDTLTASGGREALEVIASSVVDCIILDLEMPGMDGFEVLEKLSEQQPEIPVIVYTGAGSYERCVRAVKMGAYSFIDKSEQIPRVVQVIHNALDHRILKDEVETLRRRTGDESPMIGDSRAMTELQDSLSRVAAIPSPVLILGESGSGKEVIAREIHRLSDRSDGRFFAVNCGALPDELVESELFGHEQGAFTGATRTRKGAFQQASGGTIFLDEVGELPGPAQAALLRVLEQREVMRVGGDAPIKVDARVIAATNRDLDKAISEGRFREDLFYRLNVHVLRVPALRERASDVPELARHFVGAACTRFGIRQKRLSPEAAEILMRYEWRRNNVRELRNIVERMIIAADGDELTPDTVPDDIITHGTTRDTGAIRNFHELKADAERRIIITALDRNEWHITNTAADLGLADHSSLLKIMRRHNISRDNAPD